jgi:hypothetical protein
VLTTEYSQKAEVTLTGLLQWTALMEHSFNTLSLLAEILMAFVAFSAIVASLRVSFEAALTDFQKLLVQFFTVSGMLGVTILILPLVVAQFSE